MYLGSVASRARAASCLKCVGVIVLVMLGISKVVGVTRRASKDGLMGGSKPERSKQHPHARQDYSCSQRPVDCPLRTCRRKDACQLLASSSLAP